MLLYVVEMEIILIRLVIILDIKFHCHIESIDV